jgi:hypothetical protein
VVESSHSLVYDDHVAEAGEFVNVDGVSIPDRVFQLWRYTVGMKRLLLRSTKTPTFGTRIDVLFQNVKAMKLPTRLDGCPSARLAMLSKRSSRGRPASYFPRAPGSSLWRARTTPATSLLA